MGSRSTILVALAAVLVASAASAQSYVVRGGKQSFVPLTSGTPIVFERTGTFSDASDEGTAVLTLPFSFGFFGASYGQVSVNTNGLLLFGSGCEPNGGTNCMNNESWGSASSPNNYVAFWWDDMDMSDLASDAVYEVSGASPNRIFTIQFLNWRRYGSTTPRDVQVQLFEANSRVRVSYGGYRGSMSATSSATVGIQNPSASVSVEGLSCKSNCPITSWRSDTFIEFVPSPAPQLAISPSPEVLFPGTPPGSSSVRPVTIANDGSTAITLSQLALSGGDAADFALSATSPLPATLAPGATYSFDVIFNASTGGERATTLVINSTDVVSTRELLVTGVSTAPRSSVSPSSLSFTNQRINTTSFNRVVTLSNTGYANVTVSSAALTGAGASQFNLIAPTLPVTLTSGQTATFRVAFSPTTTGPKTAQLVIQDSEGVETVSLQGTGVVPIAELAPPTVAFSSERVGSTSAAGVLSVANTGSERLRVDAIALSGSGASHFVLSGLTGLPWMLEPGDSMSFTAYFQPQTTGNHTALVEVASDDPANPVLTSSLSGRGVSPTIAVTPSNLSFGSVRTGVTGAPQTVTLSNSSADDLTLTGIGISGAQAAAFTVAGVALPLTIPGGAQVQAQVTFSPTTPGAHAAQLTVVSDATNTPTVAVPLSGTGFTLDASVTPASVSLGDVRMGTTSSPATVQVQNAGTGTLSVSSATLEGPHASDFNLTGAAPTTVAAGGSTSFQITATPSVGEGRSATLRIVTDDKVLLVSLFVRGTAPAAQVSPGALSLGEARVGTQTAGRTVTVSNSGTAPLLVQSAALGGAQAGEFSFTGPTLPATVPVGGTMSFTVRATPAAAGQRTASFAISTDDQPLQTQLFVEGTRPIAQVSPGAVALGSVRVGTQTAPQTVTVSNAGTAPLLVQTATINGAEFTFSGPALPATVAVGASVSFTVRATPSASGQRSGSFHLGTDDKALQVGLFAEGTAPVAIASPTTLALGKARVGTQTPSQVVSVLNAGTAPLLVQSASLAGTHAADFTFSGPTLPATVAAGASLSFIVRASPSAAGQRAATFNVATDDKALVVALSAEGLVPVLSSAPSSADLGSQRVATAGAPVALSLQNSGTTAVNVTGLTLAGNNASDFHVSSAGLPIAVAAGGATTVNVTFEPTAVGARNATLIVTSDDPAQSSFSIALSGTGVAPEVSASPLQVSFGRVQAGTTSAQQTVTLTNSGTAPLKLQSIALNGTYASAFVLSGVPSTFPATLAPGANLAVQLAFAPKTVGLSSARLAIVTDAIDAALVELPLDGEGIAPAVAASPLFVDFGAVLVGEASAPSTVTLRNIGDAPLEVASVAILGKGEASYSLEGAPSFPATVAPGAELQLTVVLAPTAMGSVSAVLQASTDAPTNGTVQVGLTGQGVSPVANLSPSALDFGTARVGTLLRQQVVLRNIGTSPLRLGAPAISGAGAASYSVEVTGALEPIEPGREVQLSVTFSPDSAGDFAASLEMESLLGDGISISVPLSGAAATPEIALEPSSLSFGAVTLGASAEPQKVTLRNTGLFSIRIRDAVVDNDAFTLEAGPIRGELAAGESVELVVHFSPVEAGSKTGTIRLVMADASTDAVVNVSGEGVEPEGCGCTGGGGATQVLGLTALLAVRLFRRRRART